VGRRRCWCRLPSMGDFDIVYADPPWGGYTSFGTAKIDYKTMSTEELLALPVRQWMGKRCLMFVWVTAPLLFGQQATVIQGWCEQHKLTYQGMPYVWIKTTKNGKPIGASGPRPRLVKPVTEFVVALSTVKSGRTFPLLTESQKQCVFAPKPRTHSRKPHRVRELIVELLGDRPRIELFAREKIEGWSGWGDEYPAGHLGERWDGDQRVIVGDHEVV